MKKEKNEEGMQDQISKRLDALIRILCEMHLNGKSLDKTRLVQILNSTGLHPLEIARIMGKKSASDMAP